jgi:hypothetical protein
VSACSLWVLPLADLQTLLSCHPEASKRLHEAVRGDMLARMTPATPRITPSNSSTALNAAEKAAAGAGNGPPLGKRSFLGRRLPRAHSTAPGYPGAVGSVTGSTLVPPGLPPGLWSAPAAAMLPFGLSIGSTTDGSHLDTSRHGHQQQQQVVVPEQQRQLQEALQAAAASGTLVLALCEALQSMASQQQQQQSAAAAGGVGGPPSLPGGTGSSRPGSSSWQAAAPGGPHPGSPTAGTPQAAAAAEGEELPPGAVRGLSATSSEAAWDRTSTFTRGHAAAAAAVAAAAEEEGEGGVGEDTTHAALPPLPSGRTSSGWVTPAPEAAGAGSSSGLDWVGSGSSSGGVRWVGSLPTVASGAPPSPGDTGAAPGGLGGPGHQQQQQQGQQQQQQAPRRPPRERPLRSLATKSTGYYRIS